MSGVIQQVIPEFKGTYRFLSNFWIAPITVFGESYPTVEHAYQAAKSTDATVRKTIASLPNAMAAKRAGMKLPLRSDWDTIKVQFMRFLVWTKFSTHRDLKARLLSTGDARLIEGNDWGDVFWGVCNGQGENWLGIILEEVREELRKTAPKDKVFLPGPNRIFVFGSNLAGVHGGGAAKTALEQYGAKWGKGEGLQGNSYGIPTKDADLQTLPLIVVGNFVKSFLLFAETRPDLYFFVTRVGCGLAGYTDEEIAPLFTGASMNCELPEGWEP